MFIHTTVKRINDVKKYPVLATWQDKYGCKFEERYKSDATLANAVRKSSKYIFLNAVNIDSGRIMYPKDIS